MKNTPIIFIAVFALLVAIMPYYEVHGEEAETIIETPRDSMIVYSLVLSILAMVLTFLAFLERYISRARDRYFARRMVFWAERILAPICVEPLRDSILKGSNDLRVLSSNTRDDSTGEKYDHFLKEFKSDLEPLTKPWTSRFGWNIIR